MKRKRHRVLLVVSVGMIVGVRAILCASDKTDEATPAPENSTEQRDSLHPVQGAFVLVEAARPEVDPYGLTEEP